MKDAHKVILSVALVLFLAIFLFFLGWFCSGSSSSENIAALQTSVQLTAQATQTQIVQQTSHFDQRLDKLEGKIDALLKIATAVPPDLGKGGR